MWANFDTLISVIVETEVVEIEMFLNSLNYFIGKIL